MPKPLEARDDFEGVRRLISAEEEEALARFRESDFEAKLRARLAVMPEKPKHLLRLWPTVVPLGSAAIILVLAIAVFFLFRHPEGEGRGEAVNFVKAVGMLPGLTEVEAPGNVISAAPAPYSAPAGPVGDILARAYAQKKAVEERSVVPAASLSAPRLSLKKKMEILFKDKVLERVLVSIREKSKEA